MATCAHDDCKRAPRKRGFCDTHYEALRRTGQIEVREKDPVKRFWSRVRKGDCWEWTGALNHGYGYVQFDGRPQNAHRVAYRLLVGPIPEDLHIDHLCRNRRCVNPAHLEPVTLHANLLRGQGASGINARKTHCVNGHEFTPENTYEWRGTRNCKLCRETATARRARPRPAPTVIEKPCAMCGSLFSYERGPGAQPTVCSDVCREERGRRASREHQRRKRSAARATE